MKHKLNLDLQPPPPVHPTLPFAASDPTKYPNTYADLASYTPSAQAGKAATTSITLHRYYKYSCNSYDYMQSKQKDLMAASLQLMHHERVVHSSCATSYLSSDYC